MSADRLDALLQEIDSRTLASTSVALLGIWLLAGLLYGIKPAWQELARLTSQYDEAIENPVASGGSESGPDLAALGAEVARLRDTLHGGSAQVPRTRIESFVVESLDRLSGRHRVSLLSITPGEPGEIWMFDELPYDITVEGSYFAIHSWLHDVEQELRPMVLKQFQLRPAGDDVGVVIDLRIVAYRALEEAKQ